MLSATKRVASATLDNFGYCVMLATKSCLFGSMSRAFVVERVALATIKVSRGLQSTDSVPTLDNFAFCAALATNSCLFGSKSRAFAVERVASATIKVSRGLQSTDSVLSVCTRVALATLD